MTSCISNIVNPKVSIIVASYNLEKYLPTTLDSLLNQTYKNIEIVVIDDCSPGDTDGVMEKYKQYEKIVYIKNDTNQGLAATRNIAIRHATGQFIVNVDSDDYVNPDFVSDAVAEIADEFTLVRTNLIQTDEHRNIIGRVEFSALAWSPTNLYLANIVNVSTMFSKKVFELAGGYDDTNLGYEDWDFWIRLSLQPTHLKTVNKDNLFYMVRADSLSRTLDHEIWYRYIKTKHSYLKTQRETDIENLYQEIFNRQPDQWGLCSYYYSNISINELREILLNSPEYKNIAV